MTFGLFNSSNQSRIKTMKIAVIGGGNMGSAMVNTWLDRKVCKASDILVYDRNENTRNTLNLLKVKTDVGDFSKLSKYDVVVLAVKPQDLLGVLKEVKTHLSKKAIVISIAAGISIKRIAIALGKVKIVRAMPNMPSQVGMGIVGWSSNSTLTSKDKDSVKKLLGVVGYEIYLSQEKKIDALTAISGSGPAYVFYFMEALFEAGHKFGFTNDELISLVMGTFVGSSLMVNITGESPKELRKKVTSKNGVTESAIKVFDKMKLKKIISDAVKAAYSRAKELNQ